MNENYPCDPKRPSDFFYWYEIFFNTISNWCYRETSYDYNAHDIIDNVAYAPGAGSGNAYSYDFKAVRPGK